MADILARLIGDCDAQLAALDAGAAEAAHDGALRVTRAIRAKSLEVRLELKQLHAMEHQLIRRFFEIPGLLLALPTA